MNLPIVEYTVLFNKRDITRDITRQILNIQYTDKVSGESDTVEITVHDKYDLWKNGWYPEKGDNVQLYIRSRGNQLDCGLFEVDELALSCTIDGDHFVIRAIAAGVNKQLRSKTSYAHEDKSLREIVNTICVKNQLTLIGTIPDIRLHRVHQYRETDLSFLNRIGSSYGCIFSVRAHNLIFYYYKDIENRASSIILKKSDFISLDIRDTTNKTYKSVSVKHHDPFKKQTISYFSDTVESGLADSLDLWDRAENEQQAEAIGGYALHKFNSKGITGDVTLPGNLLFVAGNNFTIPDIGKLSGIYHIDESTHTINSSGGHVAAGTIKRIKGL